MNRFDDRAICPSLEVFVEKPVSGNRQMPAFQKKQKLLYFDMCQWAPGVMSQQQKPVHNCIDIDRAWRFSLRPMIGSQSGFQS